MTALQLIKQAFDSRESLRLILDDLPAKKILVAWTKYEPAFKDFEVKATDSPGMVLQRAWLQFGVPENVLDITRLAEIANVPQSKVLSIFKRLVAAHLIWPDGTISQHAMTLIRTEIGAHIKALTPPVWRRADAIPGGSDARGGGVPEPGHAPIPSAGPSRAKRNKVRVHETHRDAHTVGQ